MEEQNNLSEKSKVQLDIKALIGMVIGIVSIAGVWFTLQGEIAQLQLDVIRMQDDVELNHEFRVKWPRGEMGALPADSEQFMLIEHLSEQLAKLQEQIDEGRAPHDQQQKLTLDFYEKRLTNIEEQIEKMRNGSN